MACSVLYFSNTKLGDGECWRNAKRRIRVFLSSLPRPVAIGNVICIVLNFEAVVTINHTAASSSCSEKINGNRGFRADTHSHNSDLNDARVIDKTDAVSRVLSRKFGYRVSGFIVYKSTNSKTRFQTVSTGRSIKRIEFWHRDFLSLDLPVRSARHGATKNVLFHA